MVFHCPAICSVLGWAPTILGLHSRRGDAAVDVGCMLYPGTSSLCAPAPTPAQHMPWHCGLWRHAGYGHLSPRAGGSCPGSGVGSRLAGLDIFSLFNLARTRLRPSDEHGKPAPQLSQQPLAPAGWVSGTWGTFAQLQACSPRTAWKKGIPVLPSHSSHL